jgi:hypothetical protein
VRHGENDVRLQDLQNLSLERGCVKQVENPGASSSKSDLFTETSKIHLAGHYL